MREREEGRAPEREERSSRRERKKRSGCEEVFRGACDKLPQACEREGECRGTKR